MDECHVGWISSSIFSIIMGNFLVAQASLRRDDEKINELATVIRVRSHMRIFLWKRRLI